MPWSTSWCLTCLHSCPAGSLSMGYSKNKTQFHTLHSIQWHISDSQGQEKRTWTKTPRISQSSPCSHFSVARQNHPCNLKRAARLSHPCETLPGCGWRCSCKPPGGRSLIWEPLSASEEEILWFTKSLGPLQCLRDLDSRVSWPQGWPCWANQGAPQLIAPDSDQGQSLPGEHRSREKQTATASQSPGMPQGGTSELPASQSLCLPISISPE